eukprot:m51a1_g751 hypothetical protein (621) ;mRNA; f:522657-524737
MSSSDTAGAIPLELLPEGHTHGHDAPAMSPESVIAWIRRLIVGAAAQQEVSATTQVESERTGRLHEPTGFATRHALCLVDKSPHTECMLCELSLRNEPRLCCPQCDGACHLDCEEGACAMACGRSARSVRGDERHEFMRSRDRRPFKLCSLCLSQLGWQRPLRCRHCSTLVHSSCAAVSASSGPCTRARSSVSAQPRAHSWERIEAKQSSPDCCLCGLAVRFETSALRCVYCRLVCHPDCAQIAQVQHAETECTLGALASLVAPPWLVSQIPGDEAGALQLAPDPPGAPETMPLVVLVNTTSGARQGEELLALLRGALNPAQVFDLAEGTAPALRFVKDRGSAFRVLACGGDGTVSWVMQALHEAGLAAPVAVLPLGTGNDYARSVGWGAGYTGGPVRGLLADVARATPEPLDIWELCVAESGKEERRIVFFHNFSIGSDASVALRFHRKRESNKEAYGNRVSNMAAYAWCGVEGFFAMDMRQMDSYAKLWIDSQEVPLSGLQGIAVTSVLLNHSGKDLWGQSPPSCFAPRSHSDGLVEVIGFRNMAEMGAIELGIVLPRKVGQGRTVKIAVDGTAEFPAQYDGEPFVQRGPATLEISRVWQATVLRKAATASSQLQTQQ